MTTFTPTHDVVTEATAAGFFPPRHNVEITQVTELTDRVMRLTFRDPFIASHGQARPVRQPVHARRLHAHAASVRRQRSRRRRSQRDLRRRGTRHRTVGRTAGRRHRRRARPARPRLQPQGRRQLHSCRRRTRRAPANLRRAKSSPNTTPPLPPPYSVTATTTSPRNTSPGTRTGRGASTTPKATWSTCSTNWNKATT